MIVLSGADLFTSNVMFMTTALLHRRITIKDVAISWLFSFFGNLAGTLFFMAIITGYGGVFEESPEYQQAAVRLATQKAQQPGWHQIFLRGIGANWLHVFSPEKGPAESVIRRVHEKRQPKNSLYSPLIDQRGKNSAKLGIDSLGKPAEVILLRDEEGGESPKKRKWRSISLKDDVRKKNLSHLSQEAIVKMVGSEKDAPDQYQINANLDKLRANMGGSRYTPISVSTTEYDDVFDILFKGYTTEQLMEYVERTLPAVGPSSPHTGPDPVFLFQSIWKPGESSTSKRLPVQGRLQPDGVEQKSPKSALVTRLMQDHWRIQVQEAEDVTGEIEVGVQPWQLSLLTLGRK
ncbi:MAG: hypothetical protein Q9157_006283 [Trypethelium eluteriae]